MITTAEELLGIAKYAATKRMTETTSNPTSAIVLALDLPSLKDATNECLQKLRPIYETIIQDIRVKKNKSKFLKPILKVTRKCHSEADVILLFLNYLVQVRRYRRDSDHTMGPFPLTDIANQLLLLPELQQLCRYAISSHDKFDKVTLDFILIWLSFLDHHETMDWSKAEFFDDFITVNIYDNSSSGFLDLRSDLARLLVSRTDELSDTAVVGAVELQLNLLCCQHANQENKWEAIMQIFANAPQKSAFLHALKKYKDQIDEFYLNVIMGCTPTELFVKDRVGEQEFNKGISMGMSPAEIVARSEFNKGISMGMSPADIVAHSDLSGRSNENTKSKEEVAEKVVCDRQGCQEVGTKQCSRCCLVNYCSKECQLEDWKECHRGECKKITKAPPLDKNEVRAVTARFASRSKTPALLEHDRLLKNHPNADYIFRHSKGDNKYYEIMDFMLPILKHIFKMARQRANKHDVYVMYDYLTSLAKPEQHKEIRKQLTEEYEIDPVKAKSEPGIMPNGHLAYIEFVANYPIPEGSTGVNEDIFNAQTILLQLARETEGFGGEADYVVLAPPFVQLDLNLKPVLKRVFHASRYAGKKSPWHVTFLYDVLTLCKPDRKSSIRVSLQREYGIDLSSCVTLNAPYVSIAKLQDCFNGEDDVKFELPSDEEFHCFRHWISEMHDLGINPNEVWQSSLQT